MIPIQQHDEIYQTRWKERGSEGLDESSVSGYWPDKQPKKDTNGSLTHTHLETNQSTLGGTEQGAMTQIVYTGTFA